MGAIMTALPPHGYRQALKNSQAAQCKHRLLNGATPEELIAEGYAAGAVIQAQEELKK